MPKEYTLPDGTKLRGGPFKLNGYQFPQNWFEIAQPSDLSHWGITSEDVVDPLVEPSTPQLARKKLDETEDKLIEFLEQDGTVPAAWRNYRKELRRALRGERQDLPEEPQ